MWRSKKSIIAVALATVVLVGVVGGTVLAQNGNEGENQPQAQHTALLDRVCTIYEENTGNTIDSQQLKDAFAQAQGEMREEAMQNRLQYLIDQGTITQDEANQYKEWLESRPDVPVGPGFKGRGGFRGFGGPCVPPGGALAPPMK